MTESGLGAQELARLLVAAEERKLGDPVQGAALAREALALAEALGDTRAQALALTMLGASAIYRADYPGALSALERAQTLADPHFPDLLGNNANALSVAYFRLGHYPEGMEHALRGLQLAQLHGDGVLEAKVLSNMALMAWELQDHEDALALHQRVAGVLAALQAAGEGGGMPALQGAINDLNIAIDHYHLGHPEQALALGQAALPTLRALGLRQPEAVALTYLTLTLLDLGRHEDARPLCEAALELHRAGQEKDFEAYTLLARARLHGHAGDPGAAQTDLRAALALAQSAGLRGREAEVHAALAEQYEAARDFEAALHHHKRYVTLERALHAQTLDRKAKVLAVQAKVSLLQREAELERRRSAELEQLNAELRQAEHRARTLATHDPLTGLPNRALFLEGLDQALGRAGPEPLALLFLDLDGFKAVNDTLGHAAGDELLREVARRLRAGVRESDLLARLSGDEFVVMLRGLDEGGATQVGARLLGALQGTVWLGAEAVQVGASCGCALYPGQARDREALLHAADQAMYEAKRAGKNQLRVYRGP
ncbi:GGDEF domain-containing protein [Deinococcus multiflagellatus]|uniref:Diguanylate cyclase domain-containing protein n=1 Tax=Deinococcus multiflagellatus TaxID=1656887 RepID=A0ABW1ZS52_9DEIO|nr:GGDEF domain-containing protein [Deinococcus multiflagellatus]MBZ9712660.1 GGDEF domain-containing protein [Deinococcus multiflagellatus]